VINCTADADANDDKNDEVYLVIDENMHCQMQLQI